MKLARIGLLPFIIVAICFGLFLGGIVSTGFVRVFATFNAIFGQYLGFCIPLIVLGLVVHGIADLGNRGGRLLFFTVAIAYASTILAGLFSYFSAATLFPAYLGPAEGVSETVQYSDTLNLSAPFFELTIHPVFDVLTALILAFVLGIGMASLQGDVLKRGASEFRTIVEKLITLTIVPLLPVHIFGIFLNMSHSGTAFAIIRSFSFVIGVIFVLHLLYLLFQFSLAGFIGRKNPFVMLQTMLPAYMTALGTSSSAATIPVTVRQAKKLGISEDIAEFCIPLCATIHLSGSILKIVATAVAVCCVDQLPHGPGLFIGFVFLLGIMMVAAPGVPGGAIMAATGVLHQVLGFSDAQNALMIAIYLAIDSFGTAGNVTGDGAIAVIVDRIAGEEEAGPETKNA